MESSKNSQPSDKKIWSKPELELIGIQSGTRPGGVEGAWTFPLYVDKYDVLS